MIEPLLCGLGDTYSDLGPPFYDDVSGEVLDPKAVAAGEERELKCQVEFQAYEEAPEEDIHALKSKLIQGERMTEEQYLLCGTLRSLTLDLHEIFRNRSRQELSEFKRHFVNFNRLVHQRANQG